MTSSQIPQIQVSNDKSHDPAIEKLRRALWLRAAILGANDGLLSTTSIILGVGAAQEDRRSIVLSGLAGALAGACSMAVGEFVSVSTQRDIEKTTQRQANADDKVVEIITSGTIPPPIPSPPSVKEERRDAIDDDDEDDRLLTNPYKASAASGLAFLCGAIVPLVFAIFIGERVVRTVAVVVAASITLGLFGGFGAYLGGSSVKASAVRVLVGGWIAMGVSYGLLKPFDTDDHHPNKEDRD